MGKKKNTQNSSQASESQEDPVSQLKNTLNDLAERVGKMGLILGVETQSAAINGNASQTDERTEKDSSKTDPKMEFENANLTKEDKKKFKDAKKAEKLARVEAAKAKKAAEEAGLKAPEAPKPEQNATSEKNEFQKADMTQEEKKQQRTAKAAEKAKVKAVAAEKKAAGQENAKENEPTVSESQQESREQSPVKVNGTIPNADYPCPRSALKTAKSDRLEKEVKFDMSSAFCSSNESLNNIQDNLPSGSMVDTSNIHPAFLTLYTRCDNEMFHEVDELCIEFLGAFKMFFNDWVENREKEGGDPLNMAHDLDVDIRPQIGYLTHEGRWPLPSALGNLVRQLKKEIAKLRKGNTPENLNDWIDNCLRDNFQTAYFAISDHLSKKLTSSKKTILTYDNFRVVETVLKRHSESGLTCCVVDSEINRRGLSLVNSLRDTKLHLQYTDLKSSAHVMQRCSMVLLGCSAILSNGNITSSKGSLQLALMAKAFNVPVLVLSQSFKFVDKVQSNGRMALLGREGEEVVPADLITAVVTDIRILPPSSAPAVLKAKSLDNDMH